MAEPDQTTTELPPEGTGDPPAQGPLEAPVTTQGSTEEPSGSTQATPGTEPAPAAPPVEPRDWRDARIAKLTAQRREAEAAKTQLEQELARLRQGSSSPGAGALDELEFNRRVEVEASRRAELAKFNSDCEAVAAAGQKAYPDFMSVIGRLGALVDREDPRALANYNQFLQAAIDTDRAEHVLYSLGSDLNEASRVLGLSGAKLGVELTKLAYGPKQDSGITGAPKPLRPIGARVGHEAIKASDPERSDSLSIETWMARREAELKKAS